MNKNSTDRTGRVETGIDVNNWIQVSTWSRLLRCDFNDIISAVNHVGNQFSQVAIFVKNHARSQH